MAHFDVQESANIHEGVRTILVVEDDVNIGEVLVQAITQETPFLAMLVSDGFTALQTVKEIKVHLFILDYQLPRMNGIELYDRLHAVRDLSLIPAMMISAQLPHRELERRNILGMNKPLDLDDFLQAIEKLIA
ncbi:MAG TPA: response regulator [Dictyobacter sp.]|jgi:DNA-binding response OmpR family regulator|nr:response regulator [Dictyobacter sp.]